MSGPMKIRATAKDGVADIRVLMNHPMENGQRKDNAGNLVPLHFIQNLSVKLNGRSVIEGELSQAVSRNPVFSFRVRGTKAGDKIEISWLDNKGESSRTETAIV